MDSVNPETGNTELAAGVILETPCGISVGTGRVLDTADAAKSEFKYLAFEGDLIFSQLASVRRGDPVRLMGVLRDQRLAHQRCLLRTSWGRRKT